MHNLSILLLPNMLASSITLPMEMFNAAFAFAKSQRLIEHTPAIKLLSHNDKPVRSSSGLYLTPSHSIDSNDDADVIIIPGLWRKPIHTASQHGEACAYIRSQADKGRTLCAVGTGSALIAETGILDQRPATTHWYYFEQMEQRYPNVHWKRQHLITQSENIFCAGSINSIADLSIHLIQEQFNHQIGYRVEQQFSPEVRQSYTSQLFSGHHSSKHHDELVAQCQFLISDKIAQAINFQQLANDLAISDRTLQRRFKKATGLSPLQYQQLKRIESSKALLMNSNETIEGIANLVGYLDSSQFARVFKKHNLQTPAEYRKTVRGKLFASD